LRAAQESKPFMTENRILLTGPGPGAWLARVAAVIIGAGLLVVGFFFLTAALIAGVLIAGVIGARVWWTLRRLRREAADEIVEGEYSVVARERLPRTNPPA
jgi:hypothetical protein